MPGVGTAVGDVVAVVKGERQIRVFLPTSTMRKRVCPKTHSLALRACRPFPAARLTRSQRRRDCTDGIVSGLHWSERSGIAVTRNRRRWLRVKRILRCDSILRRDSWTPTFDSEHQTRNRPDIMGHPSGSAALFLIAGLKGSRRCGVAVRPPGIRSGFPGRESRRTSSRLGRRSTEVVAGSRSR